MSAKLKQFVLRTCRKKTTIIVASLIVLYSVIGFFLLPYLIERILPGKLSERFDSEVSLQQVRINPFKLTLEAREFQVNDPSGRAMVGFQRLFLNFKLSSLFRWALTLSDLIVDDPAVNVVIDPDGKLNLARLAGQGESAPAEEKKRPLRMLLRHIEINQGKIDVTDRRQPVPARTTFYLLNIQADDISTLPEREGYHTLTARSADGATWQWSGRISLQPLRSEGRLEFRQTPLNTPWEFVRSRLNIAPPGGHLTLEGNYFVGLGQDKTVATLDDVSVRVVDVGLQIEGAEAKLLELKEINLETGKMDIIQRRVDDVRLAIRGGGLNVINDRDGILNIQQIASRENDARPPPAIPSDEGGAPWTINISGVSLEELAVNYTDQSRDPAISLATDEVTLTFKADLTTSSPPIQARVEELGLTLKKIALGFMDSSPPAVQVNNLTAAGAFDLGARSASLSRLEMTDGLVNVIRNHDHTTNLTLLLETKDNGSESSSKEPQPEKTDPWQYMANKVSLSGFKTRFIDLSVNPDSPLVDLENITLTVSRFDGKSSSPFEMGLRVVQGGEMTAAGNFDPSGAAFESTIMIKDLALPPWQPYLSQVADLTLNAGLFSTRGKFSRPAQGAMTYQGQVGIDGLKVIENSTSDTLLGWRQLQTSDFRLKLNPNGLEIDTIKLAEPVGKLLISEDNTVNVLEAFKTKDQPSSEPRSKTPVGESPGTSFPVRIGRLSLDKGRLDFADFSLRPNFATRIHELKGVISGISSTPGTRSQVELDGRVDEYGISQIKGEINAFDPKQFTDIIMIFRNLEMTNLTPYSGKFAGRKIDYGKLSLDLQYKIADRQLLGDNKIIIDALKLGEKVDSPDAVSLPLDLAIALLKDSKGIIDIGLPVRGDLDSPEFSYGHLIWKALVNLLTRIVTSPFRALGALFGDGQETLNTVNFEPGARDIPLPEQEKLSNLQKALLQRPQLKLTVTGRYHSPSDGQAIKQLLVRRALAEKSSVALEPGEDPGPVDFSHPDTQPKLTKLFIERYGQEAYDALGLEKTPPDKSDDSEEEPKDKDPIGAAKLLLAELIKREPLDPALLQQLADARAQAIVKKLSGPEGVPPERISVQPSESADSGDPVPSALGLEPMETGEPEPEE